MLDVNFYRRIVLIMDRKPHNHDIDRHPIQYASCLYTTVMSGGISEL
ncbi:hypothetical protein KCP77_15825 [Salmonella enterica subsp. enterica]|nr:hypothetical protein KCP77_15825 [Salmonella enterica subsp. enterica]